MTIVFSRKIIDATPAEFISSAPTREAFAGQFFRPRFDPSSPAPRSGPVAFYSPLVAEDPGTSDVSHLLDMRFSRTTFLLNLEKQGLEDNTFTNGLGRDTTLIGNLVNATLYKRLLPSLEAEVGVFANKPFGDDTEVSQVRPIMRLTYEPTEEITGLVRTLHVPHQDFHNALFYRDNRFLRPIEQGAQMLVDSTHYRQDLFINWQQALPDVERRPVSSNAEGARLASQDSAVAAVAGARAATEFGLHIVAPAIQDDPHNRTRFAILTHPDRHPAPRPSGHDCTSLIVSVDNKPGAVHDMLVPLKRPGVSMSRFESRPARSGQWEYYFYIDVEGNPDDPRVGTALRELREACAFFKVLGTYPIDVH